MPAINLGTNIFRNRRTAIVFKDGDRNRHMYMLGKTGVGKSTMFQNMALQDIANGHGVCVIDPHGELVANILERIPDHRHQDVIIFDPADVAAAMGLNLLDAADESERDFLVGQLIEIFYKLFDPEHTGIIGPQFEHWLRCAALTVMAGPDGGTLLEIPKLFIDPKFLEAKRQHLRDPQVIDFWAKQMATTAEFHKSEMLNYFTSKFGNFLNVAVMRSIMGQRRSVVRFDQLIAERKILLVDLAKGKIGETNAYMLGLIMVAKLQAAVMRRAALSPAQRSPFYLYVDEFQNVITDTFASLLSEARKYGLAVHLTNQYFSQLPLKLQNAVLGNVGTLLVFQVGVDDAERLEREFLPVTKDDMVNLPRHHFYLKLMIDGRMSDAFSGVSQAPTAPNRDGQAAWLRQLTQLAYARPMILVEEEIRRALR